MSTKQIKLSSHLSPSAAEPTCPRCHKEIFAGELVIRQDGPHVNCDNPAQGYVRQAPSKRIEPSRADILKEIESNLGATDQWLEHRYNTDWLETATKYANQAEALVEILEVHDCGSVGGFDPDMETNEGAAAKGSNDLRERFEWLKKKYAPKGLPKTKKSGRRRIL